MTPDQRQLFRRLTRLQKFTSIGVLEGKSQRQAYYDAGGIAKSDAVADSAACQLLSNIKVKAFLDAMQEEAITSAVMGKTEALQRLTVLARANVKDIVDFKNIEVSEVDGEKIYQTTWALKNAEDMDEDDAYLISELAATKDGYKFKMHSQMAAIREMSVMLGWKDEERGSDDSADLLREIADSLKD